MSTIREIVSRSLEKEESIAIVVRGNHYKYRDRAIIEALSPFNYVEIPCGSRWTVVCIADAIARYLGNVHIPVSGISLGRLLELIQASRPSLVAYLALDDTPLDTSARSKFSKEWGSLIESLRRITLVVNGGPEYTYLPNQVEVRIPDLSKEEILSILEEKVREADWEICARDVLEHLVDIIPENSLPLAVSILRLAARKAIGRGRRITRDDIDAALQTRMLARARRLRNQELVVLFACYSSPGTFGEVYRAYKRLAQKYEMRHLTMRSVGIILKKLEQLALIRMRMVYRGYYGNTRKIAPTLSIFPLQKLVEERLGQP